MKKHSTLVSAQLRAPLRALALTVEEVARGEFRWRILENHPRSSTVDGKTRGFESVCCSAKTFAAYDSALATGYGELQRLVGPELQYGPRDPEIKADIRAAVFAVPSEASDINRVGGSLDLGGMAA